MKERILTNWSFRRIVYLAVGGILIYESIISHLWVGIAFGGYYAAMGLFGFGCASGQCGGNCSLEERKNKK